MRFSLGSGHCALEASRAGSQDLSQWLSLTENISIAEDDGRQKGHSLPRAGYRSLEASRACSQENAGGLPRAGQPLILC